MARRPLRPKDSGARRVCGGRAMKPAGRHGRPARPTRLAARGMRLRGPLCYEFPATIRWRGTRIDTLPKYFGWELRLRVVQVIFSASCANG